ncbi:MAG: hypothetical protein NT094_05240 [Candidatus Staskawiczbacteria bacterium]|nr:hypothetical protein [Candidatus Staskawiczbacteria bacterium]
MLSENSQENKENTSLIELKKLRNDWSDEVPEEILTGGHGKEAPQFKVRKNWWFGVTGNMRLLIEDKILSEGLEEEINIFIKKFAGRTSDFHERRTTAEDIAEANALIDKVLDSQK